MNDLSKDELQDTINFLLNKEAGLKMMVNRLMKLEREAFLSREMAGDNKANGYRLGWVAGYGKGLTTRQVGEITEKYIAAITSHRASTILTISWPTT